MLGSLPPDLEEFVSREIAAGIYESREQALAEGVRLLQERKRRLQQLRVEVQVGMEQFERGECIEVADEQEHAAFFEDIRRRGRERLAQKRPQ